LQSVENQGVFSFRKATEKPLKRILKSTKPLKIKHLLKFFSVFQFYRKTRLSKPATRPPVGTIFAGKMPVFSIHCSITAITAKKFIKSLKIRGLRFCSFLCSGFAVALQFLALLLKTCYNKAPPYTHPLLGITIKPLKLKHLIRLLLS